MDMDVLSLSSHQGVRVPRSRWGLLSSSTRSVGDYLRQVRTLGNGRTMWLFYELISLPWNCSFSAAGVNLAVDVDPRASIRSLNPFG